MQKSAWAEVRTDLLKHNLEVIRRQLKKGTQVCAVLKADAYGHGLHEMATFLKQNGLVDKIAVGKMWELEKCLEREAPDQDGAVPDRETADTGRRRDDRMEILLLGASEADEIEAKFAQRKEIFEIAVFSIYSMRQFRDLEALGDKLGCHIRVHIRVDGWKSGMGLSYEEFLTCEEELFAAGHVKICGLYSHLYTAYTEDDSEIIHELERFDHFVGMVNPVYRKLLTVHVLNSALVFRHPEYAFDMVRAGTALYGLPCYDGRGLKPVMRICAEIFDVRDVDPSVPLSYETVKNGDGARRIARIMLGYWDSPLLLTQKDVRVRIRGRLFRLADEVCMDNLCIDVTGAKDVAVGDTAVLLGEEGVTIRDQLERNGIHYVHSEWLCMTAGRLEKVYTGKGV